jgi:hypothetical protein
MTAELGNGLPLPFRRPALDVVEERELDLLLLLELYASDTFRRFVVQRVTHSDETKFLGAWRSVVTHLGETDLLLLCEVANQGRVAIMIEDKIDAPFQPTQADRYQARGKEGIEDRLWDRYYTCLCGPKKYSPLEESKAWHSLLTLEDILAHVIERPGADPRSIFLARALDQALAKFELGGFVVDPAASAFWQEYQRLCLAEYKDLSMSPLRPVQSRNEPWPRFAIGMLPRDVKLEHKAWRGCVDMTFQRRSVDEVRTKLASLLRPGLVVERAAPSSALRLRVGLLRAIEPFSGQQALVREALDAVRAMQGLWPQVRTALGYWESSAPQSPVSSADGDASVLPQ